MKWTVEQIDLYLQAKEYIDTAIIPLIPIDWRHDLKKNASMAEFVLAVTDHIENHFVGRVFQMPAFTYIKDGDSIPLTSLRAWDLYFSQNGFSHVFYTTCDSEWKIVGDELASAVICLPARSLVGMAASHRKKMISHQAQASFPLITHQWDCPVSE